MHFTFDLLTRPTLIDQVRLHEYMLHIVQVLASAIPGLLLAYDSHGSLPVHDAFREDLPPALVRLLADLCPCSEPAEPPASAAGGCGHALGRLSRIGMHGGRIKAGRCPSDPKGGLCGRLRQHAPGVDSSSERGRADPTFC